MMELGKGRCGRGLRHDRIVVKALNLAEGCMMILAMFVVGMYALGTMFVG